MAEYHLLTIWRFEAPLEKVYAVIHDSLLWPDWWPSVKKVEAVAAGDAHGINSVRLYFWQGELPYQVAFAVRATRIEKLVALEGSADGDLEGSGCWHFSRQGGISIVRYEWHVRTTRWWMNLIAPVARSLFIRNHVQIMGQGGEALARRLGSPLLAQENIDLMAEVSAPEAAVRSLQRGVIDPLMAIVAGLAAGTIATLAQLASWWLAGMPLAETLFRDARLTAALVLGSGVLPPPSTATWEILLLATLIHFSLSVSYALLPAYLAGRMRTGPALLAGGLYGLIIYVVNLYGLTVFFPWFAVARDWATLFAHLVFGITLAGCCRLFASIFHRASQFSPDR